VIGHDVPGWTAMRPVARDLLSSRFPWRPSASEARQTILRSGRST
jgi:hypothetical protein